MAKYDPLKQALLRSGERKIRMTFAEIERLVGALPDSAFNRDEWWSNEDQKLTRHVQCKAWGEAGYAASPDRQARAVVFTRG